MFLFHFFLFPRATLAAHKQQFLYAINWDVHMRWNFLRGFPKLIITIDSISELCKNVNNFLFPTRGHPSFNLTIRNSLNWIFITLACICAIELCFGTSETRKNLLSALEQAPEKCKIRSRFVAPFEWQGQNSIQLPIEHAKIDSDKLGVSITFRISRH